MLLEGALYKFSESAVNLKFGLDKTETSWCTPSTKHLKLVFLFSRAIIKNPDVQAETSLHQLFKNDFWGTPLTHSGSHKSYRPLCVLTFRLNYLLGGLDPWGYHLVNVILHALVTALFTHTALELLQDDQAALIAGLMFASHPIHTEAVAGVVGRADVLACLFFLLAFNCYAKYCKYRDKGGTVVGRWVWLTGMMAFSMAGMLSKEQAVMALGVCAVYDIFLHCRLSVPEVFRLYKVSAEIQSVEQMVDLGREANQENFLIQFSGCLSDLGIAARDSTDLKVMNLKVLLVDNKLLKDMDLQTGLWGSNIHWYQAVQSGNVLCALECSIHNKCAMLQISAPPPPAQMWCWYYISTEKVKMISDPDRIDSRAS